jgi:hypothetical protein
MYRAFPPLHQAILSSGEELNQVISANWAAFNPTSRTRWTSFDKSQKQWLCTVSGSLPVHFNLLTAELFINGLPLARLPKEITNHSMYKPLFKACTLDVANSEEPGMKFSAKSRHRGYQLHFAKNGKDLLVVAIGCGFSR